MNGPSSATYVVTAGGTGGHVFPALALVRELQRRGRSVAMLTDRRGARFLSADVPHHLISAASPSGGLRARLAGGLALLQGTRQSLHLIGRLRPAAVACFGGYASFPAAFAAFLRRVPVMIHEQNAVFGRANRLAARFARLVALSFEDTEAVPTSRGASRIVTGNPVRPGFAPSGRRDDGGSVLLVLGGSQGARVLSDVVPEALVALPQGLRSRLTVWQQCRAEDLDRVRSVYGKSGIDVELSAFFDDVPERMARASLVIGRSGASTVAEILALGKPSLLIPYLHAADGHQHANAERLARAGAALLVPQDRLTATMLALELAPLLDGPARLAAMGDAARTIAHPGAARRLADAIEELAAEACS
ncbi:MAG: undecaprenyldiphospho-muramoylpentapeptide beta-N-acetylglucosaminyltransferase [Geminicoccaceae bacterium]|nr:undecaprenyldiphospho-muramoylpentapeptide beta-N-acetylglucosaminyltransferase [Geminicoccaceae bacterium]